MPHVFYLWCLLWSPAFSNHAKWHEFGGLGRDFGSVSFNTSDAHTFSHSPRQELEVSNGKYTLPMENIMFPGKIASRFSMAILVSRSVFLALSFVAGFEEWIPIISTHLFLNREMIQKTTLYRNFNTCSQPSFRKYPWIMQTGSGQCLLGP